MADGFGYGSGFALIVVLFILLIIVGSAYICY
ncbi:YjcZ family sporulation protein [Heyndrickxia sp. NPDC080065]